jgi:acyl-CoA synthetase (AMP-forming)/AMP-acid ligase II
MWNIADLFEAIAARIPDEPAFIDRGRILTWAEFERQGEALAADLVERGVSEGGRVGVALHNRAEYLISYLACFKARCVPFNINYRYNVKEVRYLVEDAAAEALVVDDADLPTAVEARGRATPAGVGAALPSLVGFANRTTRCSSTRAARPACRRLWCGRSPRWSSFWPGL